MAVSAEASVRVETGHTDMIHDAQLDYYGRKLATAGADRSIKLFDVEGESDYRLVDTLYGHEGPIHALAWAHPSFGNILASCSFDSKVFIWKENEGGRGWSKIKEHTLHEASVNAVAWAPHELGPILACASTDGKVSVLSFNNDGTWDASLFPAHTQGVASISWAPAIGVGSVAGAEGAEGIVAVRRFATGGCDNLVRIWTWKDEDKSWTPDPVQHVLEGHVDWVRDVAWAPSVGIGRSYIASAGQDRTVFVWTQDSPRSPWNRVALEPTPAAGQPADSKFSDVVWRVSWSVSGNVLAVSSGALRVLIQAIGETNANFVGVLQGEGRVTLWKENLKGVFEEVSEITS